MALLTTTIGSFPIPKSVPVVNWHQSKESDPEEAINQHTVFLENTDPKIEKRVREGIREVVLDQVHSGIDIPTDGEVRRAHYINYHCRHLDGIDFTHLLKKEIRQGACEDHVPTIYNKIKPREHFLPRDFRIAQSFNDKPIKITVPGPLTIADSLFDTHYHGARRLGEDLSDALNFEIVALAKAGCTHIQIDEPVFARKPKEALAYGIEHLERCFQGVPSSVASPKKTHTDTRRNIPTQTYK